MPDEKNQSLNYVDVGLTNSAVVYNYRNQKYSLKMQAEAQARKELPAYMANPYTC
jgi:hypothetical protein